MMRTVLYLTVVLLSASCFFACARQKNTQSTASGPSHAKLLHATKQRTLPGVRDAQIIVDHEFTIVWASDSPPVTFFWKDEDKWQNCFAYKGSTGPLRQDIAPETIRKGDTIRLVPTPSGRHVMPAEINKDITQGLFFRTTTSSWMHLEVTNFTKRPDIKMP